jgi:hypothetical protein
VRGEHGLGWHTAGPESPEGPSHLEHWARFANRPASYRAAPGRLSPQLGTRYAIVVSISRR